MTFDDEAAEALPADATQEQGCVTRTFRPVDDEDDNFGFLASDHFLPDRTTQVSPVSTNSESPIYPTLNTTLLSTFDRHQNGQEPDGGGEEGRWSPGGEHHLAHCLRRPSTETYPAPTTGGRPGPVASVR